MPFSLVDYQRCIRGRRVMRLHHYPSSAPRVRFSKNQLPPLIEVTMVAVDEKSMIRYQQLNGGATAMMPEFFPGTGFMPKGDHKWLGL